MSRERHRVDGDYVNGQRGVMPNQRRGGAVVGVIVSEQ
jgi:hypothetical protein